MFRTNKSKVFASSIIISMLIYFIETSNAVYLRELQTLLAIYMVFLPVGYLFISSIFINMQSMDLVEKLLLSMVLSPAIIAISYLIAHFSLGISFSFMNSLILVALLCAVFFGLYILQARTGIFFTRSFSNVKQKKVL